MEKWTLLDTGPRSIAENTALDDVLLQCRNKDLIPNTIRLLQFKPHGVLVGFHQCVEQEVRLEYCREQGIELGRRITGGGTIYLDEPQLGWELIASRGHPLIPNDVEALYAKICECAVLGLKKLGVSAEFRPKNDIEVNGRKISGTGGALENNAFLFQGTLLTDFDVHTMLRALRIPIEKLKDKEIDDIKERVTCLKWELGEVPPLDIIKKAVVEGFEEVFDVELEPRGLTEHEETLLQEKLIQYSSEEWIDSIRKPEEHRHALVSAHKAEGGLIRASVVADIPNKRIQYVMLTGDFFAYPKRAIMDLETKFKDSVLSMDEVSKIVLSFFKDTDVQIPGVGPWDIISVLRKAIEKVDYLDMGVSLDCVNNVFPVLERMEESEGASVLLLPYCAKLPECEHRHKNECTQCGKCTVGDAYALAEKHGLKAVTITSFENLQRTLAEMKRDGVKAFVGSCCEAFYVKHMEDFQKAGVPGILVDIENTTCYDLDKEKEAKAGTFESQTDLKNDLLETIIKRARRNY